LTPTPSKDFEQFAFLGDVQQQQKFGMRGEPLFIEEASTSFSFFIISFSLKLA
jgi:hypothetical protein